VRPQGVCESCGYMTYWLQQKEAADSAGVTTNTIRRWKDEGLIDVWFQPGERRYLICEQSLIGHGRGRRAQTMHQSRVIRGKKPKKNRSHGARGKSGHLVKKRTRAKKQDKSGSCGPRVLTREFRRCNVMTFSSSSKRRSAHWRIGEQHAEKRSSRALQECHP